MKAASPTHAVLLKQSLFLEGISESDAARVLDDCSVETFASGSVVFREGDHGNRLFIVLSGAVEVWKQRGSAEAKLLTRYDVGRFFGEVALVDELPRSATAVAVGETTLMFLQREQFLQLVRAFPQLAESVMRSLSTIVRESNDSFVSDLRLRNDELRAANERLEQAQRDLLQHERLSNLGKMSNLVLHDIRNPVSVVQGYARILAAAAHDPKRVQDLAGRISREAARLGHLSAELIDYARGEIRLDRSVVAPSRIMEDAKRYADDKIKGTKVTLDIHIVDDTPVVVDPQRLVRVVMNLLDNARKACGAAGSIKVRATRNADSLVLEVSDSGVGMPPDVVHRMFEPFYSRLGTEGTGLGMVIVRNIVEAHGGSVEVESDEGKGTTVTVSIPLQY